MAETPMKLVVDCSTGEQTYIALSAEEIAEREAMAQAAAEEEAARQAEAEALQALKDSAKAKLIAGEPLTAEEANVLVL